MAGKTAIKVVLQGKKPGVAGWPHINFDYGQKAEEVMGALRGELPGVTFDHCLYYSADDAKNAFESDKENYDGILLLTTTNWVGVDQFYCDMADQGLPIVIADIPHTGSGGFLKVNSRIVLEGLPIPTVSSLNFHDIADAVRLFDVLKKMRETTIIVITDSKSYNRETMKQAADLWGCTFIEKSSRDIADAFGRADEEKANRLADRWVRECIKVIEPNPQEIFRSAKMHCALELLKEENGADAVTVDCLGLFYKGEVPAYPCMSFFEMGRNGEIGVCEADVDSTITSLLILYATGKTGFVSDPVIDTSSDQIIYDHCVCCNKTFGKDDARTCPYYLRSHAEDRKGVSIQTILPLGEKLTTVKISCEHRAAVIHSSVSVGNVGYESGCRTKLAAQTDTRKILHNYHYELFSWHRVTVFGDCRTMMENLFKLKGLKVVREDTD